MWNIIRENYEKVSFIREIEQQIIALPMNTG